MKQTILFTLFLIGGFHLNLNAQVSANAGTDIIICKGNSYSIGGNPTATDGHPPYSYQWSPITGLSSPISPNPIASPLVTTTYYLTVTDDSSYISFDTVTVEVFNKYNLHISASDTTACPGQSINLVAIHSGSCSTAPNPGSCNNVATIGTGSTIQTGGPTQVPSLLGNFRQSSRNQMLYKASELQAALGGPQLITSISFYIGIFNSNAFLQNFSIKVGCSSLDSLINWENDLIQVYAPSSPVSPHSGWNVFNLTTPIYWDGGSDFIVDVCNYNPTTFGSQLNKATCTQTAFKSYLFSWGNTNQCGAINSPLVYDLRPNIQFNYCTPLVNPVPFSNFSLDWFPSIGLANAHAAFIPISPDSDIVYSVQISDSNGCAETDSVNIHVIRPDSSYLVDVTIADGFCSGTSSGSIFVSMGSTNDSLHYWLLNSTYTDTLYQGFADTAYSFQNLEAGEYHLLLYDSVCVTRDILLLLSSALPVIISPAPIIGNVSCFGYTNGHACFNITGGTPPYHYLRDSLPFNNNCFYGLSSGTHILIAIDSNNCSASSSFIITQPTSLLSVQLTHDTTFTNGFAVTCRSSGGIPPYTIFWNDTVQTISDSIEDFIYYSNGMQYVTVIDSNGCSITDSISIIYNSLFEKSIRQSSIRIYPNPATSQLFIENNGEEIKQVNIYNTLGEMVMAVQPQTVNCKLQTANLPTGVYIAEVITKDASVKKRWVKE